MSFKKLTEATKKTYTEADFAWDEKAMIAEYKAAVLDYMNGASIDDALKAIKAMFKSVGDTIVTGKGRIRESTSTRVTKSELKNMIREALREELSKAKRPLKEAVPTTANNIIRRYNNNVADHILELEHEKAFNDAEWFEDEWYALEDVKVEPDYFMLIMDRPVESIQDAEAIISYAFSPANIVNIEDAMSDGGVVQDETSNELYVERWVIE